MQRCSCNMPSSLGEYHYYHYDHYYYYSFYYFCVMRPLMTSFGCFFIAL